MADTTETQSKATPSEAKQRRWQWVGWSSLFLAGIQSVCSAFVALSSIRLLVGVGSVILASSAFRLADRFHVDAIRIPMMLVALIGSVINLIALWQVWRLRKRSGSAWRQKQISPGKRFSERLQFSLSIVTLVLLAVEQYFHWKLHA